MLKNEKTTINISYRNITHYIKLGYNPAINSLLEIKTEDLPSSSHTKVEVLCSLCHKESLLMYCKYIENKKRLGFYGCKSCSRQKAAITSIEKYGVDNYSKTDEFKSRTEKTFFEKYGYKTNLLTPEHKEFTKSKLKEVYGKENFWEIREPNKKRKFKLSAEVEKFINYELDFSEDKYSLSNIHDNYLKYRNECRRITKKSLKKLLNSWNGFDYYDGEYIQEYFELEHNDKRYPTIDHKISVYYGFVNKIEASVIGSESNLCITKRSINSSKRDLIEDQFNQSKPPLHQSDRLRS